jgi:acetyltransferase
MLETSRLKIRRHMPPPAEPPGRDIGALFAPKSVAVIGASSRAGSVGQAVFRNILFNNYTGTVYPVNIKGHSIMSVRSFRYVTEIPDPVDLAVIIVPAASVPETLRQCADKQVKFAIIISAGFKESGPAGAALEREVQQIAKQTGIGVVGPNCLGIINTDPAVSLNASFARAMPAPGNIAFISQSGALGTAVLDSAKGENIGISKFVSFGNRADITEVDLLRTLGDDHQTDVILMYLEDLSNGRDFIDLARTITAEREKPKPILAMKTGRTPQGARAASSHTGSLAGQDEVYQAIFAQSGILRVETVEDLFNFAIAFANQPLPKGNRVAIVTNAGGPGIMATDACVHYGLSLAEFSPTTADSLRPHLPAAASVRNPVDVLGDAQHDRYQVALDLVLRDPNVDGAVVIVTPQEMTDAEHIARVIVNTVRGQPKPVLSTFMGVIDVSAGVRVLEENRLPHYLYPEAAVRALAAMHRYARWVSRPRVPVKRYHADRQEVSQIIERAHGEARRFLPECESTSVLDAYGFPVLRCTLAQDADKALQAAREIGYPVVLKLMSPDVVHKTEVGGVALNIADDAALSAAYDRMMASLKQHKPDATIWGVLVQQMAAPGKEVILGAKRDAQFGPVIMFGLGGIYVEAFRDVTLRLPPISELSAENMIKSIRAYPMLAGTRGEPPSDLFAIADCLERLSALVTDFPEIEELDINPLLVYPEWQGVKVADVRILLSNSAS